VSVAAAAAAAAAIAAGIKWSPFVARSCERGRQGDLVAGFWGGSRVESLTMEGTNLRLGGSGWDPVEETQGREG